MFKLGDKVVCVKPRDTLVKGKEYTISGIEACMRQVYYRVAGEVAGPYDEYRFELVTTQTPTGISPVTPLQFQVGDRVKVLFDNADAADVNAGDTGTIKNVHLLSVVVIMDVFRTPGVNYWSFRLANVELISRLPAPPPISTGVLRTYSDWSNFKMDYDVPHSPSLAKCECGCDAVCSGKHSSWCPKYDRTA